MDGQPIAADSQHIYPSKVWTRSVSSPAVPRHTSLQTVNPPEIASAQCDPQLDLTPYLFPQQSSLYQAKLLQYNNLIAPGRGGGLQTPPLPPIISSQPVHAGSRSRSPPKVSSKESRARQSSQNCHGNRSNTSINKADRALITSKVTNSKMTTKKLDVHGGLSARPKTSVPSSNSPHSSSVPSTPHQHARKFSFESREQSPNANRSNSPRSVHSETNGVLLSLRPLPPPRSAGGCKYETGLKHSRRRIPYNIGADPLEKVDPQSVKSRLSEDDERKLTTDMRELYDRLQPTEVIESKRHKLVQKLEKLLNDTWPGHDIRVHLFGSSGNLLCSDDSDVDICIVTPWKQLEGVCMLADLLAKNGMQKVVCVGSAKVPIVKVWDPELELNCDMNVNNTLALENTRMIKTYVEIDERIRPLAMIVKYWTRQRILNDAAFGGTLSSYTWICMIIAFLQLREPPILPALHQRPHQSLNSPSGAIAGFADDIDSLRGFGEKNKATLGELLFEFFRFYAHEYDYSTNVLSVRLGKLITKQEKKWDLTLNNQLCVEEPFNTNRNLGNTADDTAFRGIHIELRRAFDAIARGNLDECCEQYVYPKEEERPIFQKPQASRPVLVRSASQQQTNRPSRGGGYRAGTRHPNRSNGNHNNSNSNNRRASTLNYENASNSTYLPAAYAMTVGNQEAAPMYMQPPELVAQLSALQIQENNLRFLQYTQSQAFAQQQAIQHAQRMQGSVVPQTQTSSERSRTNSFDNPPLSAPIRPEIRLEYYYPMPMQRAQPFYNIAAYPTTSSNLGTADYRRTSHRSTPASDNANGSSGSNIRSQSQPASRSVAVAPVAQNIVVPGQVPNGFTGAQSRHIASIPIPSFIPDDGTEVEHESLATDSPEDGKSSVYYTNPSSPQKPTVTTNGGLAYGDAGNHGENTDSRHLSSEEFTRHMPNRMASMGSRSPSPISQEAAFAGSALVPLSAPSVSPLPLTRETAPLVVNGSKSRPILGTSPRQAWYGEAVAASDVSGYENPLQIHHDANMAVQPSLAADSSITAGKASSPVCDRPVVVNGSRPTSSILTPTHVGPHYTNDAVFVSADGTIQVNSWPTGPVPHGRADHAPPLPATLSRCARPVPSPLIAQLDLATDGNLPKTDLHHLSPVYETKSPSPSFARKLDMPLGDSSGRAAYSSTQRRREGASDFSRNQQKSLADTQTPDFEGSTRSNARLNDVTWKTDHARSSKGDVDNAGANNVWQKSRGRKRGYELKGRNDFFSQSELPPKNDADRKGG